MVADQPEESEHAIFTVGGRLVSGSSMKATDRANGDRRERVSGDRGRRNGDGARAHVPGRDQYAQPGEAEGKYRVKRTG